MFELVEAVCTAVMLFEAIAGVMLILLRLITGFRIQIDYYYEKKDREEKRAGAGAGEGMEEGVCPIDGHECYGATFHAGQPIICTKCVEFRDMVIADQKQEEKQAKKKKKKGNKRNEITEREQRSTGEA